MRLTLAQRKKLEFLTEEWREEPEDWKSGALFGRLEVMGLCEMQERRLAGGDVLTGPGSWGVTGGSLAARPPAQRRSRALIGAPLMREAVDV